MASGEAGELQQQVRYMLFLLMLLTAGSSSCSRV